MTVTLRRMAKKQPRPERSAPAKRTDTVRIETDLAHKLTIISIQRKVAVSDLLSPHIREWVERLYRDTVKQMHQEIGDP